MNDTRLENQDLRTTAKKAFDLAFYVYQPRSNGSTPRTSQR